MKRRGYGSRQAASLAGRVGKNGGRSKHVDKGRAAGRGNAAGVQRGPGAGIKLRSGRGACQLVADPSAIKHKGRTKGHGSGRAGEPG